MTQTLDRRFVWNLQKATLGGGAATGRPAGPRRQPAAVEREKRGRW